MWALPTMSLGGGASDEGHVQRAHDAVSGHTEILDEGEAYKRGDACSAAGTKFAQAAGQQVCSASRPLSVLRQQATAAVAQGRLARNRWDMWDTASQSQMPPAVECYGQCAWQADPSDALCLPESSTSSMVAQLNSCCRVSSASLRIATKHASSTAASTCTACRAQLNNG